MISWIGHCKSHLTNLLKGGRLMRKILLLFSLLVCLLIPNVASATPVRDPPKPTELDLLGNFSLDGSGLLFLAGNHGLVSAFTFGDNSAVWDQFDLADINLGQYIPLGQGKFEVTNLITYYWDNSEIGKTATTFFLDFREDVGKMFTSIGEYNFDIRGNKNFSIASNFEAVQTIQAAQPVPEPSTTLYMIAGVLGLALVGRKSISHSSWGLEGVIRF